MRILRKVLEPCRVMIRPRIIVDLESIHAISKTIVICGGGLHDPGLSTYGTYVVYISSFFQNKSSRDSRKSHIKAT